MRRFGNTDHAPLSYSVRDCQKSRHIYHFLINPDHWRQVEIFCFRILSGIVRKADTSTISSLIQIIGGRLGYFVLCLVTDFQTKHCL